MRNKSVIPVMITVFVIAVITFVFLIIQDIIPLPKPSPPLPETKVPYPEGWYILSDIPEIEQETSDPSNNIPDTNDIKYFFDTSTSKDQSPDTIKIHTAAKKAGSGREKTFYALDSAENIVVTDESYIESYASGHGSIMDLISLQSIPITRDGVNVITTDLNTRTPSSEIGKWLVNTGCKAFTFYVFPLEFDGFVNFYKNTSSLDKEMITIHGCHFEKDFLMIVFGSEEGVKEFDEKFKECVPEEIKKKNKDNPPCHVTVRNFEDTVSNSQKLKLSKSFKNNIANISYDGTNYNYGVEELKENSGTYVLKNTFALKKSDKSAYEKNTAKIVLYSEITGMAPDISGEWETRVFKYDGVKKEYVENDSQFSVYSYISEDGLPASEDEVMNEKLDGNLVRRGKSVLVVKVENKLLSKGLYAIETQLKYKSNDDASALIKFAEGHSAKLSQYVQALGEECEPLEYYPSEYRYTGTSSSIFGKLLGFEEIIEDIASTIEKNQANEAIKVRLIIDNR